MIDILVDRGDLGGARALVERVRPRPRIADGARLFGEAEAAVLIAEHRHAEALARLDAVAHLVPGMANPTWRPARSLRARALAGIGRRAEAIDVMSDELAVARRWGAPALLGRTLCQLGVLRGAAGVPHLREAVALLAGSHGRLEYARALHALATHAATATAERTSLLYRAYEVARRCGAEALCGQISDALRHDGAAAPPAPAPLTTSEQRIAARYADGADEHEIAEALFLTPARWAGPWTRSVSAWAPAPAMTCAPPSAPTNPPAILPARRSPRRSRTSASIKGIWPCLDLFSATLCP
ncbi:hypothetical protein [Phytohabitans rumicis]|uniref:HTH luxR-type domain-containing protein n=1 Tax=Phytohabitans rumicis TaxID=1076125 RepID=A0A6V8LLX4_9ACTN|nr:hypothetical protein [Phytohabitans rumicis]GFJ96001.1 hypothetical protein Prum_096430 [Phytohabitans rumicis]